MRPNRTFGSVALWTVLLAIGLLCVSCDDGSASSAGSPGGSAGMEGGTASVDTGSQRAINEAASESDAGRSGGGKRDAAAGPPLMRFEFRDHDFGTLSEIEERTISFPFTNTGESTLEIRRVTATCGCTTPTLEKEIYEPGESGEIVVKYEPTGPGEQRKPISVITNGVPPRIQLTVIANVEAFVELEPRMLAVEAIPYREEFWTSFTISSPDPQFAVESISTTNPHVMATLVTPGSDPKAQPGDEPREERVQVVVKDTAPWGKLQSWIDVTLSGRPEAGGPRVRHTARMRLQGSIFGSLNALPDTYRFGVLPGESFKREIILQHVEQQPYEIRQVTVRKGPLAEADVRVTPAGTGAYRITLEGTAGEEAGTVMGQVIVETDVPGEERIGLDIVGAVRSPIS